MKKSIKTAKPSRVSSSASSRSTLKSEIKTYATHPLPPFVKPFLTVVSPLLRSSRPILLLSDDTKEMKKDAYEIIPSTMPKIPFGLLGDRWYRISIGTAVSISASASGQVNSVLANTTFTAAADFASLAPVFNEFFIRSFTVHFRPVSRYQYPFGTALATDSSNVPLGVAPLQDAQPSYGTVSSLCNNPHHSWNSTGDPFKFTWRNIYDPRDGVNPNPVTSGTPTQAWCSTNSTAASGYTGSVQFLSPVTAPVLHASVLFGYMSATADMIFRNRV